MQKLNLATLPLVIFSSLFGSALTALPVAAQDTCDASASTQQELIDAINHANANCESAMITLQTFIAAKTGTFEDDYNQGTNAFPVITSTIAIEGNDYGIYRDSEGGDFRFFSVAGGGILSLANLSLDGGGGSVGKGGAILINGKTARAELNVSNSVLANNHSINDGGAIQIASDKGHVTSVLIEDTKFHNNSAGRDNEAEGEGGAIYSDSRAGGELELMLFRTEFSNNDAGRQGGALRFLSAGAANAKLDVDNSVFRDNSSPQCVFHESVTVNGSNRATDETCGQAQVLAACDFNPGSVEALIDAINRANDEVECPGSDTIQLTADLNPTQPYGDSQSAFPAITSAIVIRGADEQNGRYVTTISRNPDAPQFRFFFVDGMNGAKGDLMVHNLHMAGGGGDMAGGAVLADGHGVGGHVAFFSENTTYERNIGDNGGAVAIMGYDAGSAIGFFRGDVFADNQGLYGGGLYVGGFGAGSASAMVEGGAFSNNEAAVNGGAIYNNGQGEGSRASTKLYEMALTGNTSERVAVVVNDADRGGNADFSMSNTSMNSNVSRAPGGVLDIVALVDGGGTVVLTADDKSLDVPGYTCFSGSGSADLAAVACP